jgi:formylglycine-generating enzyme required for sulfatase activity
MGHNPPMTDDLCSDPLLRAAPTIEGFKVLDPVVLFQKLGQGGMGAVYRGRHCKLDLDVAVKCLRPSLADEAPEFALRFEREARLAASLGHQNVVRVLDVHRRHGIAYLVMEYVRGENARERVRRKGPLAPKEALAILFGAALGLAEAHRHGIVHRDIKPDNVLIGIDGRVKLADLGLAKAAAAAGQSVAPSLSLASGVMGTPQYMAPEQWDSPDVGPEADVWALGATLWFLLTGTHGIEAPTLAAMARRAQDEAFPSLRQACPALDEAAQVVFERCVHRDPKLRFADAGALVEALRPLVAFGERDLADPAAHADASRAALVSPPPKQTLLRIRARIESDPQVDAATLPTVPSPRHGGRRRWPWLFAVGAIALVVLLVADQFRWFDDEAQWEETMRYARARTCYHEAMDLLPQQDQLDAAVRKLEETLQLWPDYTIARPPLALALARQAERILADDLDGAATKSERAFELAGTEPAVESVRGRVRTALAARLAGAVTVEKPTQRSVVDGARFVVQGAVQPHVQKLRLELFRDGEVRADEPVAIVAGAFEHALAVRGPGEWSLRCWATDRHGVTALAAEERRVVVAGVLGDLASPATARIVTGGGLCMLPVPPRTFLMGTLKVAIDRDDDEQQHEVVIENPFWLAETEVTRWQWATVMGFAPNLGREGAALWLLRALGSEADLPMGLVSHADAEEFCARLTERERAAGRLPEGYRYCLPTEAQWELAALGGGRGPYGEGIDRATLPQFAVYRDGEADGQLAPVRKKRPNALGFHDLFGNVAEWCADSADGERVVVSEAYAAGGVEPLSTTGANRLVRGGYFNALPQDCRAASRQAVPPDSRAVELGFRPALAKR